MAHLYTPLQKTLTGWVDTSRNSKQPQQPKNHARGGDLVGSKNGVRNTCPQPGGDLLQCPGGARYEKRTGKILGGGVELHEPPIKGGWAWKKKGVEG